MQHIQGGQLAFDGLSRVVLGDEDTQAYALQPGDILFNRTNSADQVGKTAVFRGFPGGPIVFASYLIRLRVDVNQLDPEFVAMYMNSHRGMSAIRALATPGVSQYNINPTTLGRYFVVPVPPLAEQRSISRTLGLWEASLSQMVRLLAVKRRFKHGLIQKLLIGERRFKEFGSKPWTLSRLGDLITESRVASSNGRNARRLTVRLYGKGVVSSADRQPGSERTKYYRRSAGQFIYSKLDFLNGACGIVPPELDGYETTLDLPTFDVSPEVDGRWLSVMVSQRSFYLRHVGLTVGGRKAKRLNPRLLLGIQASVPGKNEQTAIADFLELLDREISTLARLHGAFDRQRRGVAELLLTGKVRIGA